MLDTCLGRPAPGVGVTLCRLAPGSSAAWERVAAGATNRDGRIPDLLPPADWVQPGRYRITFDVAEYQVWRMVQCSSSSWVAGLVPALLRFECSAHYFERCGTLLAPSTAVKGTCP